MQQRPESAPVWVPPGSGWKCEREEARPPSESEAQHTDVPNIAECTRSNGSRLDKRVPSSHSTLGPAAVARRVEARRSMARAGSGSVAVAESQIGDSGGRGEVGVARGPRPSARFARAQLGWPNRLCLPCLFFPLGSPSHPFFDVVDMTTPADCRLLRNHNTKQKHAFVVSWARACLWAVTLHYRYNRERAFVEQKIIDSEMDGNGAGNEQAKKGKTKREREEEKRLVRENVEKEVFKLSPQACGSTSKCWETFELVCNVADNIPAGWVHCRKCDDYVRWSGTPCMSILPELSQ